MGLVKVFLLSFTLRTVLAEEVLKSVRVHFAYGIIALTLELLGRFWTRMIAVILPFFSYLFRGSSGSKSKVDCIAISKVRTTGMLVVVEGPPDKRAGASTSSNWQCRA